MIFVWLKYYKQQILFLSCPNFSFQFRVFESVIPSFIFQYRFKPVHEFIVIQAPSESQICIKITNIDITATIGTMLRSQVRARHTHYITVGALESAKASPETLPDAKLLQPCQPTYSCRRVHKHLVNISQSRQEAYQVGTIADGAL